MNKEEIVNVNKTELYEEDLLYGIMAPKPSCKFCHGTGKEAWDAKGEPVLCRCLKRKSSKPDWITAKVFKDICKNRRPGYESKGSDNNTGTDKIHSSEVRDKSEKT